MANLTDGIGSATPDELLRMTGTAGNPYQTTITNFTNTGIYVGENRAFDVAMICKAASGTTATLTIDFYDSDDGTTYATMSPASSLPSLNATSSQAVTTGSLASPTRRIIRTKKGRPYVRCQGTLAGSTGTWQFAVMLTPIPTSLASS